MVAPARRRVSYVIPPPQPGSIPRLQLPPLGITRLGSILPLLIPFEPIVIPQSPTPHAHAPSHPKHRLPVASLALDSTTHLVGKPNPEGILYTGGRDGMVVSWDLHLPMRQCPTKPPKPQRGRWEMLTGWGDDWYDDGEDDTENEALVGTDGDVLGDVTASVRKRRKSSAALNRDEYWELDPTDFIPGQPSVFRQCAQLHSDWVNDILLCNQAQTVVSASSDGTLKAWNPHTASDPTFIGSHSDYVRCLAHCRDQNWVASGSFDKTIKLWDLNRASHTGSDPLITLKSPDGTGSKSSVYAIAVDPGGSVIASGTPERVIRTWDPRSGKRTAKLVGHTDNIRAILISADGKYLLTGSADASVKLWSLSAQKCIHAFTHHNESVWSLFSSHPSLEVFYSGDRSGLVCRVDVEGSPDISEGECILLSQSPDGVNKIVAMDDQLVWTASGSSSVTRWKVPPRRNTRLQTYGSPPLDLSPTPSLGSPGLSGHRKHSASIDTFATARTYTPPPGHASPPSIHSPSVDTGGEDALCGIPFRNMVKLISANETFTPYVQRGRDPEIATLYSAASVRSVPRLDGHPHVSSVLHHAPSLGNTSPLRSDTLIGSSEHTPALYPTNSARNEYEDREVASEAEPLLEAPDYVIKGDNGLVRSIILNNRMHALTVDTAGEVAVWDIIRCICLGKFIKDDVSAASHSDAGSTSSDDSDKNPSPREALETVRERVEGQAVVSSWSSVDTKMGLLSVHLSDRCFEAEIYADEAGYGPEKNFGDELRLSVGRWLLRNLFLGFVREQQRLLSPRRSRDSGSQQEHSSPHRGMHRGVAPAHIDINSSTGRKRSSSDTPRRNHSHSTMVVSSPSIIPAVPPPVMGAKGASPLLTPMIPLHGVLKDSSLQTIPQSPQVPGSSDMTPVPLKSQQTPAPGTPREGSDYFSHRFRSGSISVTTPGDEAKTPSQDTISGGSGSGLMGRLRNLGKGSSRRALSDIHISSTSTTAGGEPTKEPSVEEENTPIDTTPTPLQILHANISIPSSSEAPLLALPLSTVIYISEETSFGWATAHRGTVGTTGLDARTLEGTMPMWLLEYLLTNRVPVVPMIKVGFVLHPYPSKRGEEQLPDLLNTSQSKLTASRFLRVRKLTTHVQDKLSRITANTGSSATTPRSSVDALGRSSPTSPLKPRGPRGEEIYEIVCNDIVLPLDMTLAAVKQYIWRQNAELTMYYRRRVAVIA